MGLMDALGGALTAGTHAAAGQQEGELAGGSLIRQILMQQAHMGAQTAHLKRQDAKPQLGDAGYGTLMGAVKGDEAAGETPALVEREKQLSPVKTQTAVNTAAGVEPIHVAGQVAASEGKIPGEIRLAGAKSNIEEGREGRLIPQRAAAQANSGRMGLMASRQFNMQNKALVAGIDGYSQAKDAFAEAKRGNPAALKSALLSYAAVADPKAQLRQGVMNYVTKVDPSFKGTFEMALDQAASGKLPAHVIANMEQMVDRLHQSKRGMYEQRRHEYVGKVPASETYIPSTETLFDTPGQAAPSAQAPGTFTYGGKTYKAP